MNVVSDAEVLAVCKRARAEIDGSKAKCDGPLMTLHMLDGLIAKLESGKTWREVAILGGGDWADASVDHVQAPHDLDMNTAKTAYQDWLNTEYYPVCQASRDAHDMFYTVNKRRAEPGEVFAAPAFMRFSEFLRSRLGCRPSMVEEIEE